MTIKSKGIFFYFKIEIFEKEIISARETLRNFVMYLQTEKEKNFFETFFSYLSSFFFIFLLFSF